MSVYRRLLARLALLGFTIVGAAILNSDGVAAQGTDCPDRCLLQRAICLDGCHGNASCVTSCNSMYQACLKDCSQEARKIKAQVIKKVSP